MARPKVLEQIDESIITSEEEEITSTELPLDADTLKGHPVEYFASKVEVNQAILNYASTVLGTSY